MNRLIILALSLFIGTTLMAQSDSIPVKIKIQDSSKRVYNDTVNIGRLVVVNHHDKRHQEVEINFGRKREHRPSNISTNWWIFDLGFSNFIDNTNYAAGGSYFVNKPGAPAIGEDDFKLNMGKSVNVNIWFFMQRLNLIKHYVNLKYGLGLELNNYRYNSSISYKQGGVEPYNSGVFANSPFVFRDSISFTKNKLAADYLTVPLMLNFATDSRNPGKSFNFSAGISGGFLYSERNKQKSPERGKQTNKGDYDMQRFKFAYIGELGLGPIHLYGSYSPTSMYQRTLVMHPYTIGIRFSNW